MLNRPLDTHVTHERELQVSGRSAPFAAVLDWLFLGEPLVALRHLQPASLLFLAGFAVSEVCNNLTFRRQPFKDHPPPYINKLRPTSSV
jgi:hypothetical protein